MNAFILASYRVFRVSGYNHILAYKICKLTVVAVFFIAWILGEAIAFIPGQARPDDPNACVWYTGIDGDSVFRCCDGYLKEDTTNLTEKCTECPLGWYGFGCQKSCHCNNGGTCNIVDGSCLCTEQYFGYNCQYPCNCQNGGTCMQDGTCLCVDGFYAELCQRLCSCPQNIKCDKETGECFCHEGYYGFSCLPCNCSINEQCDRFSGTCACKPGYYGKNCDRQCSCFNGAYCADDNTATCKCQVGWLGSGCTDCDTGIVKSNGLSFCKEKCLHCYNGHTCSIEFGDCECSAGWHGKKCDKVCEQGFYGNNCSENCQCKRGICDHVTGICQCDNGWTGDYCDYPCPENCVKCEGIICTSCKPGWTGERCLTRCKHGFHGDGCQEPCTECNCSTSCHHVSGSCPEVVRCAEKRCKCQNCEICMENPFRLDCQDGWTGSHCNISTIIMITTKDNRHLSDERGVSESSTTRNIESPTYMDESFATSTLIPVVVVVALVLINIAVITIACYYRKRKLPPRNRNLDYAEIGENIEMNDHQRTKNTSDYENISRGATVNSEDYQHLCDFTHSQYQKLDTSTAGGSC